MDLLATVPFDQIIQAFMDKSNVYYELLGLLKLGRVLRLNKIISFLNVTEDVKASMKLTKMIFFLVIYIHLFACIWWIMVERDKIWQPYIH